jgi:hypothetical protein
MYRMVGGCQGTLQHRSASQTGRGAFGTSAISTINQLSAHGDFAQFLELDHLRVLVVQPEYLLAMKCLAFRIGEEFHDEDDIRYLLRHLDIQRYEKALAVIGKYYSLERFPQKTFYALAEPLPKTV